MVFVSCYSAIKLAFSLGYIFDINNHPLFSFLSYVLPHTESVSLILSVRIKKVLDLCKKMAVFSINVPVQHHYEPHYLSTL